MTGAGGVERRVDLGLGRRGGARDDAVGHARVGRDDRVAARVSSPTQTGTSSGAARVVLAQRVGELRAHRRAAQLEHRLVDERRRARGGVWVVIAILVVCGQGAALSPTIGALLWPGPSATRRQRGVGGSPRRRVSLAFLIAGGLAAFAGTLVPDPDPSDHAGCSPSSRRVPRPRGVLGALAQPPEAVLAALPAVGILMVGAAVAIASRSPRTPAYYLLPLLASAYFGSHAGSSSTSACSAPRSPPCSRLGRARGARRDLPRHDDPGVFVAVWCPGSAAARRPRRRPPTSPTPTRSPARSITARSAAELDRSLGRYHATGRAAALLLIDLDHFK